MPPVFGRRHFFCTMKINLTGFICLLFLHLYSCNSRKFTLDTLPTNRIEFGTMHGITGSRLGYVLLENGQLFERNEVFGRELKSLPKREVKWIFLETAKVARSEFQIRATGNERAYLIWVNGANKREWIWPSIANRPAPDPLLPVQLKLNELVKNSSVLTESPSD